MADVPSAGAMTLDEFKRECDAAAQQFRDRVVDLMARGTEAKIEPELMAAIFIQSMERLQQ